MARKAAGITEQQDSYIREDLNLSKHEISQLVGHDVQKIADLTKAEAFQVIEMTIDNTVLSFHPGAKIKVEIKITDPAEGLPASFRGDAEVKHYQVQMADGGLYMNAVIYIPALQKTITRGIGFLRSHAKLLQETEGGREAAQKSLDQFHFLQDWYQKIIKNIAALWWKNLHAAKLPSKALHIQHLSPAFKRKLAEHMLGYMEREFRDRKELTDEMMEDAFLAVVGYAIFGR